jgi:hypothetical protein
MIRCPAAAVYGSVFNISASIVLRGETLYAFEATLQMAESRELYWFLMRAALFSVFSDWVDFITCCSKAFRLSWNGTSCSRAFYLGKAGHLNAIVGPLSGRRRFLNRLYHQFPSCSYGMYLRQSSARIGIVW